MSSNSKKKKPAKGDPAPADEKKAPVPVGPEKVPEKSLAGLSEAEKKEFSAWCVPYVPDNTEFGLKGVVRCVPTGGTKFVDKEELAKQNGVVADVLKSMGGNMLQFKSVINVSLPVRIFESRSYLERITDVWCYTPIYLRRAALCKDPVERLKWVITFLVSGLHRGVKQVKPFNPILGETSQCEYKDGTKLYFEQLAHHPPITGYEVIGPNRLFYFHGYHEYVAGFRPTGIVGGQKGDNIVEFLDGTKIVFPAPSIHMTGLYGYGDRAFNWIDSGSPLSFVDAKNNLKCDLRFNPDEVSGVGWVFGSKPKTPSDHVRGIITHLNTKDPKNPPKLCEVEGSWLDGISFDGIPYWTMNQLTPYSPTEIKASSGPAAQSTGGVSATVTTAIAVARDGLAAAKAAAAKEAKSASPAANGSAANGSGNGSGGGGAPDTPTHGLSADALSKDEYCVLPSDCRYRADLIALKQALANGSIKGEMDVCQKIKEQLEVAQRKDRKLRKELTNPKWLKAEKKKH